ncbi:hypothetical protein Tco_1080558 [Tanacetum coccineum]|uniref:Uncharacterized protein n=1 Tax=Tanacetum coccineum TaxID=301880 RepID=A0ABQ5HV50_9ASTR
MQLQDPSHKIDPQINIMLETLNIVNLTQKFANEVDELRALPGHMLGAARVQVPEYDLYDLKLTREEDGVVETLDP